MTKLAMPDFPSTPATLRLPDAVLPAHSCWSEPNCIEADFMGIEVAYREGLQHLGRAMHTWVRSAKLPA